MQLRRAWQRLELLQLCAGGLYGCNQLCSREPRGLLIRRRLQRRRRYSLYRWHLPVGADAWDPSKGSPARGPLDSPEVNKDQRFSTMHAPPRIRAVRCGPGAGLSLGFRLCVDGPLCQRLRAQRGTVEARTPLVGRRDKLRCATKAHWSAGGVVTVQLVRFVHNLALSYQDCPVRSTDAERERCSVGLWPTCGPPHTKIDPRWRGQGPKLKRNVSISCVDELGGSGRFWRRYC